MFGALRLFLVLLVLQTIAYVGLSLYSRSVRRAKLEAHWDRKKMVGDRDAFIARGLKVYDNSFRRKLILGVYIVPWVAILTLIYVVNYM
ncbi:hypothetical protein FGK63_13450 [Ruegeria sediminis]|uniref:Cation/multidrug efflux pump n=1 Tax=Ruegeria sediminis TaxID=2583820 RepID=A0ABY2WWJ5_9RHOB|nr:hypothetical protein [Ruegeria sediminis]TMV07113.1 hypothetical protein FGK63_13450 [Ruegeria sediminis]